MNNSNTMTDLSKKSAQQNRIPLRDFFRNPEKSVYRISPDGRFVSHTEPYERRMNVFVEERGEIGKGKAVRVTSETARDINSYGWKNNDTLIYIRDFDGDELSYSNDERDTIWIENDRLAEYQ